MHPAQQYAVSSSSSSVDGLTGPSLAADEPPVLRSTRFAPVRLSAQQLDGFHDAAHDALAQTVRDFVGVDGEPIDTARWRHVRSHIGASVYYERHRADKQQLALLVAGTLKARLADVMEGLYMDTTETTRLVHHHINARFVDAEVLKVIEQRSPRSPYAYTGLKWAMLKASASGMVSSRDICYLEKLGVIEISRDRKLGYFVMQSVDLPECPPSPSSKIIRAHISLCYLFEETKDGFVGLYMTGSMAQTGPKMLWKMTRMTFADVALSVIGVTDVTYAKRCAALLRAKRLAAASAQHETKTKSGSVCEICHTVPTFFERLRECDGCQKMSVCKKCRVKRDVLRRESESSKKLAKATFCFDCMEHVKYPNVAAPKKCVLWDPEQEDEEGHSHRVVPDEREPPPRRFKPLYDDDSPRGFRTYDDIESPQVYTNPGSMSSTFEDDRDGFGEADPDSERSLRTFTLKLRQQLEDIGYDEIDATSRHDGLAMLGSGRGFVQDCDDDELVSSLSSAEAETAIHDSETADVDEEEEEEILSVRLMRRSVQPPEMLEAQTLNPDGSLRKTSAAYKEASPDDLTRSLLSRLEEASLVAKQTHEQLQRSQVFLRSTSRG